MISPDKVTSFIVDHTKLQSGIYEARSYRGVTTFDVRFTKPNVERSIDFAGYHSLEHLLATWFRSSEVADDVVAVDGMACFSPETLVQMYDGSQRKIKDVHAGDVLMGDDSTPRKVLREVNGVSDMYLISQSNACNYVVSRGHQLELFHSRKIKQLGIPPKSYVSVLSQTFDEFSKSTKSWFRGYKVGFELPERNYSIPPYILGLWLGDGVRSKPCLCINCNEPEILSAWREYAESIGCHINIERDKGNSIRAWIHHNRDPHKPNPFMESIKELNLYKNKHIPEEYFCGSMEQRAQLLAGLLNSDGWSHKAGVTFGNPSN